MIKGLFTLGNIGLVGFFSAGSLLGLYVGLDLREKGFSKDLTRRYYKRERKVDYNDFDVDQIIREFQQGRLPDDERLKEEVSRRNNLGISREYHRLKLRMEREARESENGKKI